MVVEHLVVLDDPSAVVGDLDTGGPPTKHTVLPEHRLTPRADQDTCQERVSNIQSSTEGEY